MYTSFCFVVAYDSICYFWCYLARRKKEIALSWEYPARRDVHTAPDDKITATLAMAVMTGRTWNIRQEGTRYSLFIQSLLDGRHEEKSALGLASV
jgi:hypothetical protein